MSVAVTLVHAPGAVPEPVWERLLRRAPGSYHHESRIVVRADAAAHDISGAQLATAIDTFLADVAGADRAEFALSTAGVSLASLEAGSPLLHPGMVILIAPRQLPLTAIRATPLSLCLDSGPDAGRLLPLRRGGHVIGRGQVDVSVADPRLSRREAVLDVGAHDVRLKSSQTDLGRTVTTTEGFELGTTAYHLVLGAPPPAAPQSWPPHDAPVDGKPPEGRNTMMLAFALVPLVAGVVLVLVTGLWFFLLFSGASALVATIIFLHGRRQRSRYRRARQQAAEAWGAETARTLLSPGRATRLLRGEGTVHVSANAQGHPAVRLGLGRVQAQLQSGETAKSQHPERVVTAVGVEFLAGETTTVSGPRRERLRILRWILLQLVLNPVRGGIVVVGDSSELAIAELRDLPTCRVIAESDVSSNGPPSQRSGVLLCAEPLEQIDVDQALRAGWHVVLPAQDPADGSRPGWEVSLGDQTVHRRGDPTAAVRHAEEFRMDGLSDATLRELCRLAVPRAAFSAGPDELPERAVGRIDDDLFAGAAANELVGDLGAGTAGCEKLDLVSDGPHVLIAGTTGSGKSELLKTLLLSLCARYSPQELTMVLVDFKGGATFQHMARVEHILGVVTDLSQAATERTIESIRSELVRRERLFLSSGAGDYTEYRMLSDDPLPRMLVVIDEFRIFAHELPHQLDELMRLATLGRSLGLHLVLSTQRPQGAVTADIRANIGAAIALRMRGEDESRDVIGTPDAAEISRRAPGRALLRRPGERPVELQTALLRATEPALYAAPESLPVPAAPAAPTHDDVITTLVEQLRVCNLHRVHTPLLPPLPQTLGPQHALSTEPGALLGQVDDPASQSQYDLRLDPQHPQSYALIGEAAAAAAAVCLSVTSQLLTAEGPVAVYLLDGDRSLTQLDGHPRVGAWLSEEHMAEAAHLVDQLCRELADRRMGRGRSQQPLVLVITGYSQWLASPQTGFGFEHQLATLVAEGPQAGISVLLAGGRELAVGKLSGRFAQRIYLPFGSGEDVTYLWPKLRSTDPLPGRGVLISSTIPSPGLTVQLSTETSDHSEATTEDPPPTPQSPVIQVRALPDHLTEQHLSEQHRPHPETNDDGVVVAVQQLTWAPVSLQLGPVNLILGSPGTGKSSCLRLLDHRMAHATLMHGAAGVPDDPSQVLLIDDAHRCTAEQHHTVQQAITAGARVVATAPASGAVFSQLPWAHPARTQGSNVILSPVSRSEAESFAAILPLLDRPIPGRAVHLRPEGALVAQWAVPPDH